MYDQASLSNMNPWRISDTNRNTREIQSVGTDDTFAQDHTFQVTKNYLNKKKLGVAAVWTCGTGTGEIACAVLVRSTKTEAFAHAAQQLMRRSNFNPKAMHKQPTTTSGSSNSNNHGKCGENKNSTSTHNNNKQTTICQQ